MTEGEEKKREEKLWRSRKVSREEQGDLLADAITGFFAFQREEESAEETLKKPPIGDAVGEAQTEEESVSQEGATLAGPTAGGQGNLLDPDPPDETAVSAAEQIPDSPWEQKMAWAKARAQEGRQEEAEELYRELVSEDPSSVRALNNLGVLLDEKGDSEGAVAQLRAAQRIEPHNREVIGNLGAALGAMGRYADAEEVLRSAFRADPSDIQIRANLGILLFRRGLYEQAVDELEAVCAAKPEDGMPLFYRGEALNRLGRVDEAIEVLKRVTDLLPLNPKAYYTLGVLFDKQNIPEKAAVMYRKARELTGS